MNTYIRIIAYGSLRDLMGGVNSIGTMLACTPKQLDEAIAVYANPKCFLDFKSESDHYLCDKDRARAKLESAIQSAVRRVLGKYKSQGNTSRQLAQIVGITLDELVRELVKMKIAGVIHLHRGVWYMVEK